MNFQKIAAFSMSHLGGNPAGVVVADQLPNAEQMQTIARDVGFSETVFAAPLAAAEWEVRYFSPEAEIPFCGHATIALAASLAMDQGDGAYRLHLSADSIEVTGRRLAEGLGEAAFLSPPSSSQPVAPGDLLAALDLFGLERRDLFEQFTPALIHAGASHLFLPLKDRSKLAAMGYDFERGQALAREKGWVTVLLAYPETATRFHVRNAFAFGGVYEDPATGAAAAALTGYLRATGYAPGTQIHVLQGDDMGVPCRLSATIPAAIGDRVSVRGTARRM